MSFSKIIVGFWDINKKGCGLGSLLIFQEELLQYRDLINAAKINLYFCSNSVSKHKELLTTTANLNPHLGSLSFIKDYRGIKRDKNEYIWPNSKNTSNMSYVGSYLAVQELWKQSGNLFRLKSPGTVIKIAEDWISNYVGKDTAIAVHLKNNLDYQQSNANQDAWFEFILNCYQNNMPVMFVLIGNDKIDSKISKLPNVVLSKDHGGDLELDLALIELSSAFMGMSSGPCNMAILSDKPYLIWKHPGHHKKEMEIELQGHKQFVFANNNQKFMQDWDTLENIQREFSNLFRQLKPDFYKYQSYVD